MNKKESSILKVLVGIPLVIVLSLYSILVFKEVWNIFLVPLNIPALRFVHAFGILLLVEFTKRIMSSAKSILEPRNLTTKEFTTYVVIHRLLYPTYVWVLAYIVSYYL